MTHKPRSSNSTTGPHPRPLTTISLQLSELDSDNEPDPDLLWREVLDIPSFQLREAIGNQQPTENDSFSLKNTTSPPSLSDSHDRDGL